MALNTLLNVVLRYLSSVLGCVHAMVNPMVNLRRLKENLQELGLSYHGVEPRNGAQVFQPSAKALYPLSHLTRLTFTILAALFTL